MRRLAPHIADAIRTGLLLAAVERTDVADAPGLVIVAPDGSAAGMTDSGARWLDELRAPEPGAPGLPVAVRAPATAVQREEAGAGLPRMRVRTNAGRWAVLHASRLPTAEEESVAVIIEPPSPAELAPLLMLAYGLTRQEQAVTRLVCRGLSTRELADMLCITPNTLQDHLKSIFDKTGVRTRRELMAVLVQEQYLPRAAAGTPVDASGSFAS